MAFEILSKTDTAIRSLKDWLDLAPPKEGEAQWKDGRSAKELAKAWLAAGAPAVPREVHDLLESHPSTRGFQAERAWPEQITNLDDYRGGQRNHDLIVVGSANGTRTLLGIEGKADETFGPTLEEQLRSASSAASNIPKRMDSLCQAVFGSGLEDGRLATDVADLRYQLLHALAGTLLEAASHGCEQAVLIVHEFRAAAAPERLAANARDLDRFVSALTGSTGSIAESKLVGPVSIPGAGRIPGGMPFFIGKACR